MNGFPPYPIREACRRPSDWLRLGGRAARLALRASAARPQRLFPTFSRAVQLLGREGFRSGEIQRLQLLEHGLEESPVPAVSRRGMERIAATLNPSDARTMIGDKAVFQRVCEERDLPVPHLLGLFRGDRPGWAADGSTPAGPGPWHGFLVHGCPDSFVVKPIVGGYGRGVRVFTRISSAEFRDAMGTTIDAAGLVSWMQISGRRHGCVIQERVRGHADLERLSAKTHLQTARVYTLLDRDGEPHLLHSFFKLIAGRNFIDNFDSGATGNLIALMSLEEGVFGPGVCVDSRGRIEELDRHPDTGATLAGFHVPDWDMLCSLALRAARVFAPLRLVGWDIAPTPAGPVLIEGNWNPDPPNFGGRMDRVLADLRRLA